MARTWEYFKHVIVKCKKKVDNLDVTVHNRMIVKVLQAQKKLFREFPNNLNQSP